MSVSVDQLAVAGGTPVRDTAARPWPTWPIASEEDIAAVADVLRSGKWNRWRSDRVDELEAALREFTGAAHVVALASGTAGLEVALKAAGVRPGDEVILPAYTYVATATAVLQVGGVPVFADIIPETENIDPASIESLITERTRALLPVHISGLPCDMAAINALAARHGLRVIEDTAQGIGGMWNGQRLGTIGDVGEYSFQASKNLPGGEGGAIVTNDPAIAERAFMLMHINNEALGWNYRLTAMQAALILSQLHRFPAQQARRQANAAFLRDALAEIPGIAPTREDDFVTGHGLHGLGVRFISAEFSTGAPVPREAFSKALHAEGIPMRSGLRRSGVQAPALPRGTHTHAGPLPRGLQPSRHGNHGLRQAAPAERGAPLRPRGPALQPTALARHSRGHGGHRHRRRQDSCQSGSARHAGELIRMGGLCAN